MIAFVNNQFLEEEKATLQVSDLSIQRGYAAFDFFRTKNYIPLFLDDYLDRFLHSISLLRLQPLQTREELKSIIHELIRKNQMSESGIRMILTGGYSPDSYEPVQPNLIITQQKILFPASEKYESGLKVITHEYQRDLPQAKSINYLMGVWLLQKVKDQKAADVLYHQEGIVSEFPRANVFVVTRDEKIITPSKNILGGITRLKVLKLAAEKYKVETRTLHIDEIKDAAEVFMTSTTKRLLPVTQVDDTIIGNGKAGSITTLLNQDFIKMEDEFIASFHND
jgi:D-alanine transaminase/branched-chain amino acid aminotransferase